MFDFWHKWIAQPLSVSVSHSSSVNTEIQNQLKTSSHSIKYYSGQIPLANETVRQTEPTPLKTRGPSRAQQHQPVESLRATCQPLYRMALIAFDALQNTREIVSCNNNNREKSISMLEHKLGRAEATMQNEARKRSKIVYRNSRVFRHCPESRTQFRNHIISRLLVCCGHSVNSVVTPTRSKSFVNEPNKRTSAHQ